MIKLAEDLSAYDLSFFEDDIFFQRIFSDFRTISGFDNVFFYVCEEENEITAVISKVCGVITISAKASADFEEINEFVKVVGFTKILCDAEFSVYFDGLKTTGEILKIGTRKNFSGNAELLPPEKLKDAYGVITKVFEYKSDFQSWFPNTCYGMIHDTIKLCGVYYDDILVSVAFALFITEKNAVISSVATLPEYRTCGHGTRVVKTLLDLNAGKDIYVFTENKIAEEWYRSMGFVSCKKWSEIENVL